MKKLLILSLFILAAFNLVAQRVQPNKKNLVPYVLEQDSVKGYQIFINEKNELQFICIIDNIDLFKDEMYNKLVTYFTPPYKDAKSELTLKDRKLGKLEGNRFLKNYSKTGYEYMNSTTKTNNVYTFSADLLYRVDIKKKKIRIKFTVQRFKVDVQQLPISSVHMDYAKSIGRSAPLQLMRITDSEKVISAQLKNSLNKGSNISETKAFDDLTTICITTIEEVKKIMYGIVDNKANTDDW